MSSTPKDVRYEVNVAKNEWKILPKLCQEALKTAVTDGNLTVTVTFEGNLASVHLGKMTIAVDDNNIKNIRCAIADNSHSTYYVWSFKDDNNVWKSYHPRETILFEEAFDVGEHEKKVQIAGKDYTIHFRRLHQESVETGYRRKISRVKSNATEFSVKTEPVADSATCSATDIKPKSEAKSASSGGITKSMMTTLKGRPPIDPEAVGSLGGVRSHIFVDDASGDVYDVLLNQTNVSQNNNKYYIVQLIEADSKKQYWTWTRWGRVGYRGQNNLEACGSDLDQARQLFETKFSQKTANDWADRKNFVKHSNKYDLIERDFGESSTSEVEPDAADIENVSAAGVKRKASSQDEPPSKKVATEETVPSKLDVRLQQLLELICDIREMEEVVVSLNYDVQKAPLGKLTEAQLKAGYAALQKIADIIESKDSDNARQVSSSRKAPSKGLSSSARQLLIEACNEFYTRVPHCFGMRQPPLISTHAELKSKLELLETLGDIEIAIHSMKEEKSLASPENPLDKHYRNLRCTMDPVETGSAEFALIDKYLHDTHGQTHNTYKTELLEVFAVSREDELKAFREDVGNNVLLWHGSRLTNYFGILSQGLRIAPPEAPVTGYMFGKGVYFADCASKSANYCQCSSLRNVGFLMLCKVALGKANELVAADYKADKLPKGCNSVKGLGKFIPDDAASVKLADGTIVPVGRLVPNKDPNSSRFSLLYNEYVVYNTDQIAMKYICKVKFNYSI